MANVTKSKLLNVEDEEDLAELLFPPEEGYKWKKERGIHDEIIVIVDDIGTEVHLLGTDDKPSKSDYTRLGDWGMDTHFKFVFQRGEHLLLLGRTLNPMGQEAFRHTRVDWDRDGLSRSFTQTLNKLDFGQYGAFEDLFERKEVTDKFYEEFIEEVNKLTDGIQNVDTIPEARRIAFTLAERLLFLHFIQTKGLLDHNENYIAELAQKPDGNVYDAVFRPLFFEHLNGEADEPGMFGTVPELNGGLFRLTEQEEANPDYTVDDEVLLGFLDFLGGGRWNWHLDERADVDEPNTLDPALLGHIFEKTVNQKDAGAYYTPRVIARYMAQQGIWGYLGSKLDPPAEPNEFKRRLEELAEEDKDALAQFAQEHLAHITLLDNACGSGAFLLAGLEVLLNIWEYVVKLSGRSHRAKVGEAFELEGTEKIDWRYQLIKWIASRNLFGVDIEQGAIEIAKLRLWLALMTRAPDDPEKVEPLPNIDYNLRTGNSLVGFTHFPMHAGKLRTLEADCSDLIDQIPGENEALRKHWKPGAMFTHALRTRQRLIHRFRHTKDHQEATQLKNVIDAFDKRVNKEVEQLWEDKISEAIEDPEWMDAYQELRDDTVLPFHWWYEFPDMMGDGGPCVILTNPPWEVVEAQVRHFHARWWPDLLDEQKYPLKTLDEVLERLWDEHPDAKPAWEDYQRVYGLYSPYFKRMEWWSHQGRGRPNFYKLFFEHYLHLIRSDGWIVPILPGGVYNDSGCSELRRLYWESTDWQELLGFENRWPIFEHVDSRDKIALLVIRNRDQTDTFDAFLMAHAPDSPYSRSRFRVEIDRIHRINPETLQVPEVQSDAGLSILEKLNQFPCLGEADEWPVDWVWEVHKKKKNAHMYGQEETSVPLMEVGTFHQFDDSYAPPQFWLDPEAWASHTFHGTTGAEQSKHTRIAIREVARNTDVRTVIAARIPPGPGVAHTAWTEKAGMLPQENQVMLLGLLNSLVIDWQARRNVSKHVTKTIIRNLQLPTPVDMRPYAEEIRELVRTLEDSGGPYDETRARLDALIAHVCGLAPQELGYIWSDFRVLAETEPNYIHAVIRELEQISPDKAESEEIRQLIAAGESATVEFESSARWDYRQDQPNRDLQQVILKTIAGFLNRDGGELFVGVDDDGVVLGLEKDYQTLGRRQDRDGYEQFLIQAVANSLGTDIAGYLDISFPVVDGHEICHVKVEASSKPVYLEKGDEMQFYVRAGNSTRPLNMKEAVEYIQERWG